MVANHISAWTVAGEDAQVSFGSCFGLLCGPTLVVMLLHAYGAGLPSIAGGEWQTELEKLLGVPVVEATGAAAAAGDRPVGTLSCHPHTRTIHYFYVSAKIRSMVVSPEVLVCPRHLLVRLQTMAGPREWCVQVVRRLPAVPIFQRLGRGYTSSATHHQRKRRRGRRRALTAASAGCGSVSVPMSWLHVQIATVRWALAPATRP